MHSQAWTHPTLWTKTVWAEASSWSQSRTCDHVCVFSWGGTVHIQNFRGGLKKQTHGKVLKKLGSVTFLIQGQSTHTMHVDHMLSWRQTVEEPWVISSPVPEEIPEAFMDCVVPEITSSPMGNLTSQPLPDESPGQTTEEPPVSTSETTQSPSVKHIQPDRREALPKRLNLLKCTEYDLVYYQLILEVIQHWVMSPFAKLFGTGSRMFFFLFSKWLLIWDLKEMECNTVVCCPLVVRNTDVPVPWIAHGSPTY